MRLRNKLLSFRLDYQVKQNKNVSQAKFAQILGVNKYQYGKYERQESQPSLEIAWKLADKLTEIFQEHSAEEIKIRIEDLFEKEE